MDDKLASILYRLNELVDAERSIPRNKTSLDLEPRPQIRGLLREAIDLGYGDNNKIESLMKEYL